MTREEQIEHAWFCKACLSSHCYDEKSFKEAAKWADKTMIDNACELLNNLLYNRYAGNGQHEAASCENITKKEFIENFKRLMEE